MASLLPSLVPEKYCIRVSFAPDNSVVIGFWQNGRFILGPGCKRVAGSTDQLLRVIGLALRTLQAAPGFKAEKIIDLPGLPSWGDQGFCLGIEFWPDSASFLMRFCQGGKLALDPVLYPAVPGENSRPVEVSGSDRDPLLRKIFESVAWGIEHQPSKALESGNYDG